MFYIEGWVIWVRYTVYCIVSIFISVIYSNRQYKGEKMKNKIDTYIKE